MKVNFAKLSPFQVDPEKIEALNLTAADFEAATNEEKESVVYRHKSVSYWRDAARRFRSNTVSMVALFVFILCLLFAFLGPKLIPYNYSDQYRSSQKLSSMQYSEDEQKVVALSGHCDAFFATVLQPGSLTAIKKGDYFIDYGGKTYAFTLKKAIEKAVLALDADAEAPLFVVKMSDINEDGSFDKSTPVELSEAPAEGASPIRLSTGVFPHVFGTDSSGRDLMARTMFGAQVSIIIGIVAAIIVLIIGSIYGAISGLAGGAVDFVMMRVVELIYSIPEVLIVLLLQVVLTDPLRTWFDAHKSGIGAILGDLGPGIVSIFITFALLYWVTMARIVRGQVLQLKKQEFVTAAVALGASGTRIIRRHLLPNAVGALVITTCLQIPSAIFLESFLSFLGLGVSAPMASLGSLCSDALATIELFPDRLIYPAVILTIIVLSLNLIGDGLRDALDPRLKK
ncbi:MAG: ABC transporter permease [Clostridia bacterium]|nr:ABC transporter permease [Clostridia bacterium]